MRLFFLGVSEITMKIKGRPIGIWLICLSLIIGILEQLYLWADGEQLTIGSVFVVCCSLVFSLGLYSLKKWVCIVFVFVCGGGAFLATAAAAIFLGANSVGLGNNWSELISRYWMDAAAVLIAYCCVYYLTRREIRNLFLADERNKNGKSQDDLSI